MPTDPNDPCQGCAIARGELRPAGGVLLREGGLVLHGFSGRSPIPGWLVVTSERHARALYDLDARELAALGPLVARVMRAQREALGAEHVTAYAIGEVLRHFHVHLIPRFADTPERLRGPGAFSSRPEDARPEAEVEEDARKVGRALGGRAG